MKWPSVDCRKKKPHWWYVRDHECILIEDPDWWDYLQCIKCGAVMDSGPDGGY